MDRRCAPIPEFVHAPRGLARAAVLVGALLAPPAALGWGEAAHRIVARAAETYLSSVARTQVGELLRATECGDAKTLRDRMACASTWADWARGASHPQTYNWHFVDIPLGRPSYDADRDCRPRDRLTKGTCVVDGLDQVVAILRGGRADPAISRAEALMFVLHLVADLHQPLHTVLEDVGGNDTYVRYFGAQTNLHQIWDSKLVQSAMRDSGLSERAYARRLEEAVDAAGVAALQRGDRIAWVEEAHRVAVDDAYGALARSPKARDGRPDLGAGYLERCRSAADLQLERAAARLAAVLNDAFR